MSQGTHYDFANFPTEKSFARVTRAAAVKVGIVVKPNGKARNMFPVRSALAGRHVGGLLSPVHTPRRTGGGTTGDGGCASDEYSGGGNR